MHDLLERVFVSDALQDLIANAQAAEEDTRWADALRDYRAVLVQQPTHIDALLGIGRVALLFEHFDEALTDFTKVLVQDPNNAEALRGRGLCYFHGGQEVRALDDLCRAVALAPHAIEPLLSCGQIAAALGHWDEAIQLLQRAMDLAPNDGDVALELAQGLLSKAAEEATGSSAQHELLTRAKDALEHATRAFPDDALTHLLEAERMFLEGDVLSARQLMTRALQSDPSLKDWIVERPTLQEVSVLSEPR